MHSPLQLLIDAPFHEALPVLTSALLDVGGLWQQRVQGRTVIWHLEGRERQGGPTLYLVPDEAAKQSWLLIETPPAGPEKEELVATLEALLQTLYRQNIPMAMVEDEAPFALPGGRALFVAPNRAPYLQLVPLLISLLKRHGLQLRHLAVEAQQVDELYQAVAGAQLVIGPWESGEGHAALLQARAQGRPTLALAPTTRTLPNWLTASVRYAASRTAFLHDLDAALRLILAQSAGSVPTPSPATMEVQRRRIYRQVALNRQAPPEQRFHAARVLIEVGEAAQAAEVLGAIALHQRGRALAEEALTVLGSLGEVARPVLWYLDALTSEPLRALKIAQHLSRAGDPQTALFRLERLVQEEDPTIRARALEVLAEMGELALPTFLSLARRAPDLVLRLRATRWLHEQGSGGEQLVHILYELAMQGEQAEVAAEAVRLLEHFSESHTQSVLTAIAHRAPMGAARLAAAQLYARRGTESQAQALFLQLAHGSDHLNGSPLTMEPLPAEEGFPRAVRLQAASWLGEAQHSFALQQVAARVFLKLEQPEQAQPILLRLVQQGQEVEMARWAAQALAQLGPAALEALRAAFAFTLDPVAGQHLAEGILQQSQEPADRRQAAHWLARHSNLPRAVEVLGDLALSARVSGSEAVQATNDLHRYAAHWAGAARVLATLATDSPHAAVRSRSMDLLLRAHPSELPLSLLLDLALTGSLGTADRSPVMEQLTVMAQPAANRIVSWLADESLTTGRRWSLLHLMSELPERAITPALLQLSTQAAQDRIRYVAAEQLILRGHIEAGYSALTAIAIHAPDWVLRERSLYELAQRLPDSEPLLQSVVDRTRYEETFYLARDLLAQQASLLARTDYWLDRLVLRWDRWVASLPLGWLDRLVARSKQQKSKFNDHHSGGG